MTYDIVSERSGPAVKVSRPEEVFPLVERYRNKRQEHFLVLTLHGDNTVNKVRIVTIGILNRTLIHPREVFVAALKDHAASVILCHNHPSGNLAPSSEDLEATNRLYRAGSLLGIPVLDHLIIGGQAPGFYSFRERGLLPSSSQY